MTEADLDELERAARRRSARVPASSPPTPWRWCRRRSASRCPARRCCRRCIPSASRWRAAPARSCCGCCARRARCRATSSRGRASRTPRRRRRHRRLDQCRAAPARDRARGRHPLHPRRRRRGVRAHAADRQPEARRRVPRAGPATRRRRAVVLKALLDGGYLHGDALALSRPHPRRRARAAARARRRAWCAPRRRRFRPTGGVVVLKGNLCPTAP